MNNKKNKIELAKEMIEKSLVKGSDQCPMAQSNNLNILIKDAELICDESMAKFCFFPQYCDIPRTKESDDIKTVSNHKEFLLSDMVEKTSKCKMNLISIMNASSRNDQKKCKTEIKKFLENHKIVHVRKKEIKEWGGQLTYHRTNDI